MGRDFAALVEMITQTLLAMDGPVGRDLAQFQPHCVVSDSLCFWGKLWAAKLACPYVCSTTTFAFNRHTAKLMKQTPGHSCGCLRVGAASAAAWPSCTRRAIR